MNVQHRAGQGRLRQQGNSEQRRGPRTNVSVPKAMTVPICLAVSPKGE